MKVRRNGETVVPRTFIGAGADSGLAFELRGTADHRLFAIVESSAPDIVLAVCDVATSETWPRAGDTEHYATVHQRGLAFLARLQQSHPGTSFILSENVPCSRTTKL